MKACLFFYIWHYMFVFMFIGFFIYGCFYIPKKA